MALLTPTGIKQHTQVKVLQADSPEDLETAANAFLTTLEDDEDHNYFTYVSAVSETSGPTYTLVISYTYVDINITGV